MPSTFRGFFSSNFKRFLSNSLINAQSRPIYRPVSQKTFEPESTETPVEALMEEVRDRTSDLEIRLKSVAEIVEDSASATRKDLVVFKKEIAESKVVISRLQARVDNQLLALVLANIASGVGVAALILGATAL